MKILIGNPPWFRSGYYGVRAGSRWPHFERNGARYYPYPFFMGYAASLLEREDFDVRVLDGVVERMKEHAFLSRIAAEAPDIVVLEVSTPSWDWDRKVIDQLSVSLPGVPILLAGIHAFMYEDSFFESYPAITATIRGEYELTLLEASRRIRNGENLHGVDGLVWRASDGSIVHEKPRELLKDLDSLPWPHRSQLPMDQYIDGLLELPQPCLQMWASRGCPYKCGFCAWPQIMYATGSYRMRSPESVVEEMIGDGRDKGFRSVYFDDDVFNVGDRRMKRFVDLLKDAQWDMPWGIMARADTCSASLYEEMREVGLEVVKFGVESGEQSLIDSCGKRLSIAAVRDAVRACKTCGIRTHLTFMFGLPGETATSARKTIELALELDPETIQFSLATPFPGSRFYDELDQQGYLVSKDWSRYDGYSKAVVRTDDLSSKDLERFLKEAYHAWATRGIPGKSGTRSSRLKLFLKRFITPLKRG